MYRTWWIPWWNWGSAVYIRTCWMVSWRNHYKHRSLFHRSLAFIYTEFILSHGNLEKSRNLKITLRSRKTVRIERTVCPDITLFYCILFDFKRFNFFFFFKNLISTIYKRGVIPFKLVMPFLEKSYISNGISFLKRMNPVLHSFRSEFYFTTLWFVILLSNVRIRDHYIFESLF